MGVFGVKDAMVPRTAEMPEVLAVATRGGTMESRHWGHAVVVNASGEVVLTRGYGDFPTYPRSSLKPLQALAGVAAGMVERFGLTPAEVAVVCASHRAERRHRDAVAAILRRIDAEEADLRCGPHDVPDESSRLELVLAGRQPGRIYSNCSGKHAGMLALARVLDAPLQGYWLPEHPVQRAVQGVLAAACSTSLDSLAWGLDGCGVPTYLMPLRELALGFARLAQPDSLPSPLRESAARVTAAMMAEPEMVRGTGGFDTVLMRALPGVVFSKGGAEGCQCVGIPSLGLGLAVKVEDGSARALAPVTLAMLDHLGVLPATLPPSLERLRRPVILNTNDEPAGEVCAMPW